MNFTFAIVTKMRCSIIGFVDMLIKFGYVVILNESIINICIRTRTLEGDGGKPSRHENEGALLLLFFYVLLLIDVRQRGTSPTSSNYKASRTFRICGRPEMPLFKC